MSDKQAVIFGLVIIVIFLGMMGFAIYREIQDNARWKRRSCCPVRFAGVR